METMVPSTSTPVSMGTSIMAVTFNGGVILGADSRTTTGNYIANRITDKITPLCDNVYTLRSGSASDTQAIAGYVQHFIAQHQAEEVCQAGATPSLRVSECPRCTIFLVLAALVSLMRHGQDVFSILLYSRPVVQ